ncbi:hypothetical protein ACPV5L_11365 [Vibrio astriarenae]
MPKLLDLDELSALGIHALFDAQDLSIRLIVDNSVRSKRALDFQREQQPGNYSPSAGWNMQNHFNLSSTTNDSNQQTHYGELNGGFNIGGVKGVNGIYRGYANYNGSDTNFYRGSSYLFIDRPEKPWRLSLGDVTSTSSGHLSSINLGGVSWQSNYGELQPYRILRASSSQSFELSQTADVDIFINNLRITTVTLPPGRYDLDNLPLNNGTNEIRLEVRYISGTTEVLLFSQFYNSQLLKAGFTEYNVSLGVESSFTSEKYSYDSDPILSGYVEHGLNDSWTLGGNGLLHKDGQVIGTNIINGNRFGNIGVRLSSAFYQNSPLFDSGWATSLDYSHQVWGAKDYPNLRIGLESLETFNATPWYEDTYTTQSSIQLDYTWSITDDLDWNVNSSWIELKPLYADEQNDQQVRIDSYLRLRLSNLYVQAGVEHQTSDNSPDDTIGYFNLDYYFNHLPSGHRFYGSYNGRNKSYRAEVSRNSSDYVGNYGYSISGEHNNAYDRASTRVNYNANRWRGEVQGDWRKSDSNDSWSARATLNSSVTVSEQGWAIHRASNGPQALVKVHPTLKGSTIDIGGDRNGSVEAKAYSSHSNIIRLTRAHDINRVTYDSPDAPLGYALGDGQLDIRPGTLTLHLIPVGSDASHTIVGTLVYPDGSPVSLIKGKVTTQDGEEKTIFTNRIGRFALEDMSPGRYKITINNHIGEIYIDDNAPTLIYMTEPLTLSNILEAI